MAKKNYQKVNAWNVSILSEGADSAIMTLQGKNSKGTAITVTVKISDYEFPRMISDMAKIGKARVENANNLNRRIINSVNQ